MFGAGYVDGSGFVFGGNDDAVVLPATFGLTSQEFTVEAWIKRSDPVRAGLPFLAGEFFAGGANGFSFGLTDQGHLYISHVGVANYYSSTSLRDTNWHHVAVTREGGNLRFYLDSILVSTVPCSVVFDLKGPYAIGGLGTPFDGVSYGFLGGIDELAVYGRALSQPELAGIFLAGATGKCGGTPPVTTCTSPPDTLIAWYRAEENATDWTRVNPGTFSNPQYAEGKVGKAFAFDGTNDVSIPDGPEFNVTALTIEAWIYPTSLDSDVDIILNKEVYGFDTIAFEIGIKGPLSLAPNTIPTGNLTFHLGGVAGLPSDYSGWTDCRAAVPLNSWSHVALTYGNGATRIYLNGLEVRNFTGLGGALRQAKGPLKIGSRSDTVIQAFPTPRFNGRIDEVSLYSRALRADEVRSVFRADTYGKCAHPIPVTVTATPTSQRVVAGSDTTFFASVAGTKPLTYQWRFNEADIPNATGPQLTLKRVGKTEAGEYRVTVCNPAGCVTSAPATLTVLPAPATVKVVNSTTTSPRTAVVPIVLIGNGVENAVSFSLHFDQNLLTFLDVAPGDGAAGSQMLVNSAQAGRGVIGVAIAQPAGTQFAQGANELIKVNFRTEVTKVSQTVNLSFVNSPTASQLVDVAAAALPAVWMNGQLTLHAAFFEGDMIPRPAGDKAANISDWVQVGRFVAGLDDIVPGTEFQRADCAPLATFGNGALSVSDWVQAGRFAIGLDPLIPADGPEGATAIPNRRQPMPHSPLPARAIRLKGGDVVLGQSVDVAVILDAAGDENAIAFSLHYNPTLLRFLSANDGSQSQGAFMNVNAKEAAQGRIGIALALTAGGRFNPGQLEVARLRFTAPPDGKGMAGLTFADTPILREVASPLAETLQGIWQDSALTVISNTVSFSWVQKPDGPSVVLAWPVQLIGATLESTADVAIPDWRPVVGTPLIKDAFNTITISPNASNAYFRLKLP